MQVQKVYNGRGSQGCKHALRRLRAEAKGSGVQTEGEEKDLSPSREERKVDGQSNYHLHI